MYDHRHGGRAAECRLEAVEWEMPGIWNSDPLGRIFQAAVCNGWSVTMTVADLSATLDVLQCGALLLDRRGRIVHANGRVCELMQRSTRDVVGTTLLDHYPSGPGRETVQHVLDHFEEACEREFHLPRADGAQLPVIVSGRRLPEGWTTEDYRIVTVIEISRQKAAESSLQERYLDIAKLSDTVLEQALALKHHAEALEVKVRERTLDLHAANMDAIYMLAVASEAKDHDTGAHVRRIEHYSRRLASALGLPDSASERISYSAILHDVGKIHVPDGILQKPTSLSDAEWEIMREHTIIGERILSPKPFFDMARSIARSHHENWDGSGYPDGLSGTRIPLAARIVRVADVFDALTTARSYKSAWSAERAAAAIQQWPLFDPDVVDAFQALFHSGRFLPLPGARREAAGARTRRGA